ncbi:MAG TPA: ATP-dependent 6-phosphofructokinase [Acidimicrobiales bacterium]|nr:ATP-dependent 6-phosphofructokinase [Acidimicrobiales bacterium]
MKIGLLTGGGDCPGLNAVIRAVVGKGSSQYGDEFIGFLDGWRGVIEDRSVPLDWERCRKILFEGGTILGSSRTNVFKVEGGLEKVRAALKTNHLDALVAIGGDDTLGVASKLSAEGVNVVGVPKTIDNDLSATEVTFGFHTAVQIATEAIDRLRTTSESHNRVIICEVMGRHAGWIALYSGIAGGAVDVLLPEQPFDVEEVCERLRRHRGAGRRGSVVVVAEGATPKEGTFSTTSSEVDQFGHVRLGGVGNMLASEVESRTGFETRSAVLGHIQRGGTPLAFDRVLATRFGIGAIDAVHDGGSGTMVALQADKIVRVPLAEAVAAPKLVPADFYADVVMPLLG